MKKTKKKIAMLFALVLCAMVSFAQNSASEKIYSFIVWFQNGEKVIFSLDDRPVVTYNNDTIVVSSVSNVVEYPHELVHKFTLTDGQDAVTRIKEPKSDKPVLYKRGFMIFTNCIPGESVSLYDAAGKLVNQYKIDSYGALQVPLQQLNKGLYIFKMNSLTYKFIKK